MNLEFIEALDQLEKERGISKDVFIDSMESALVSAYKKEYDSAQNIRVCIDPAKGEFEVLKQKEVVEEVMDPTSEVSIEDAKAMNSELQIGDILEYTVTPESFGRIAAQTAKQVVVQRLREAERSMVFDDFSTRQGEIVTGNIQRIRRGIVFLNLGKAEGILPINEQTPGERYVVNNKLKVYIMDVKKTNKGPQVYLSRSHPGLVKKLFEFEVPEIADGMVEIKGIAREAGSRTKIAVAALESGIDPLGACVGSRGMRVQTISNELFDERIDIIEWSDDPVELIANVLRPAKVEKVILISGEKSAIAIVPDYQLSLAIGKEGQNVRLAAKVSGWKIDIKSSSQYNNGEALAEYEFSDDPEIVNVDIDSDADYAFSEEADGEDGI